MSILRQTARAAVNASRSRAFSSTTAARKDLVQDLYLKEIKTYKAPPPAKDAHVGSVKAFTAPPAPQPPVLPSDLASELTAYDVAEPGKGVQKGASSSAAEVGTGAEAFLELLEEDESQPEVHH